MATRTPNTSAFITKVLAPLPGGAEPVGTAAYEQAIRDDLLLAWEPRRLGMEAAKSCASAANFMRMRAIKLGKPNHYLDGNLETCREEYLDAIDALMMLPAPHVRGLRWKQEHRKAFGGDGLWETTIAADEARLEKPRKAARGTSTKEARP